MARPSRVCALIALATAAASSTLSAPVTVGEAEGLHLEVSGVVDVRLAAAGEHTSWLDGGFGRTRYGGRDSDRDGLADQASFAFHASQLSLVLGAGLGDALDGHLHVNLDADGRGRGRLDRLGVVEAYVAWTRILSPGWRLGLRGGITIPPFTLEHPETAWSTRYTMTPSAIGSWLGEEVKATGVEATFIRALPDFKELQLQAGLFSGNDSSGALLAWRGWALHDRQGQLGDDLPLPPIPPLTDPDLFGLQGLRTRPFRELDGRPGYHLQARYLHGERGMLQAGFYDNNADRDAFADGDYGWRTRFLVVGGELHLGPVSLVAQLMDGTARMGPPEPPPVDAAFRAGYVLASLERGRSRFTGRLDAFDVEDEDFLDPELDDNRDDGWAGTVAWIFTLDAHQRLAVELLHVRSEHPFATSTGERASFSQAQLQAGYRYSF